MILPLKRFFAQREENKSLAKTPRPQSFSLRTLRLCVQYFSLSLLSIVNCFAQDIHFSQFTETPLLINPALTGLYNGEQRASLNHKNQWTVMGNPYKTTAASFDMPMFNDKKNQGYLGAGINIFRDKAGDSQFGTTQVNLSISGILPMDEFNKISVGIQGGIAQRSANISTLQWGSQYSGQAFDTNLPANETNNLSSFNYADMAAGAVYEFSNANSSSFSQDVLKINAGISCYHVNKPLQKFIVSGSERLNKKWVAYSAMRWDIPDTKISLVPSVMYLKQSTSSEINLGTAIRYKVQSGSKITGFYSESAVSFGCHYRFKDAIIPQLYYEVADYAIGISYDFNTSAYSEVSNAKGGIELSLRYTNLKGALRK